MKPQIILLAMLFNFFTIFANKIDATQSSIQFEVNSFGAGSVKGDFQTFSGDINWNENDVSNSSIDFEITSNSVTTKSNRRTKFIKSEDFFNVSEFPEITFEGSTIIENNWGYSAIGYLNVKGITKKVEIPFNTYSSGLETTLLGNLIIDRFDYDIGLGYKEWMVAREVSISIKCVIHNEIQSTAITIPVDLIPLI